MGRDDLHNQGRSQLLPAIASILLNPPQSSSCETRKTRNEDKIQIVKAAKKSRKKK